MCGIVGAILHRTFDKEIGRGKKARDEIKKEREPERQAEKETERQAENERKNEREKWEGETRGLHTDKPA